MSDPLATEVPADTDSSVATRTGSAEDRAVLLEYLAVLAQRWRLVLSLPIGAALVAFACTFLIPRTYTARTTLIPPPQQQSAAASALASLSALSGLVGNIAGSKTTGDQFVSLMQSVQVQDRIIDRFKLMDVYEVEYREQARRELGHNVRIALGKKDGFIAVETDAETPKLAADMANQYVEELRRLAGGLALTEAKQRRVFFEGELQKTRVLLTQAQQSLQRSGIGAGAIKTEPRAAAEGYATLRASATAAEVRLQTLLRSLAETAPEVQQQRALLGALRTELGKIEQTDTSGADADYIGRYREFKYQETLFDLLAKQYELARIDESREHALIQVVDAATPPERASGPRRVLIAAVAAAATLVVLGLWFLLLGSWRQLNSNDARVVEAAKLRAALRGR